MNGDGVQPEQELPDALSLALAARIREALAQRRMSRQRLADDARISLSTLEKALNGSRPFTHATVVRLEQALGIALRQADEGDAPAQAPTHLGAYSPVSVKWLEGEYLTLRPSFGTAGALYAYQTSIGWSAGEGCLTFRESNRVDAAFAQRGVVSLPNKSGHIYLHTNEDGQLRLAILGRPVISGEMYGIVTTLLSGPGTQLQPVSAPLALVPLRRQPVPFGRIMPDAPEYAACRAHLDRALSDGFVRLVTL
jgi:transcriptional regulator with XRE-family HTH domain